MNIKWKNRIYAYIVAFLIPVLYLLSVLLFSKISYTTVDDVPMMHIIAGYKTGAPLGWALYLNPIQSIGLSVLYSLIPDVNWYTLSQLAVTCLSLSIINYCHIHHIINEEKYGLAKGVIFCILLDGVFCWLFIRLHFYNPAIVSGCAAISIVADTNFRSRKWLRKCLLFALLWAVSISYTFEVAKGLLCYLGLMLLYKLVELIVLKEIQWKRAILRISIATMVTVIIAIGLHSVFLQFFVKTNGSAYTEWNKRRIPYQDYPITTYSEDPDRYLAQGWDEDLFLLSRAFYYMDMRINARALDGILYPQKALNDRNAVQDDNSTKKKAQANSQKNKASLTDEIKKSYEFMDKSIKAERQLVGLRALIIGMLISSLFLIQKNRSSIIKFLLILCSALGCFVLGIYLGYIQRMPLRAAAVIAMPGITVMTFGFLPMLRSRWQTVMEDLKRSLTLKYTMSKRGRGLKNSVVHLMFSISWKRMNAGILALIISIGIMTHAFIFYAGKNYGTLTSPKNTAIFLREIYKEKEVYAYAKNNTDKIIVYDWSSFLAYDPFPDLKPGDLRNLFPWGSSRYNSFAFRVQLASYGMDKLRSENFADENIYFISNKPQNIRRLTSFLKRYYGIDQCYVVEKIKFDFLVLKYCSSTQRYRKSFNKWVHGLKPLTDETFTEPE